MRSDVLMIDYTKLAKLLGGKLTVCRDSIGLKTMFSAHPIFACRHTILSFPLLELTTRLQVIGNLPFNITSQILFSLCDHYRSVRSAVVTMQLEVRRQFRWRK